MGAADASSPDAVTVEVVDVRQSDISDVAVAKLRKPVNAQKLHIGRTEPAIGDELVLAGWGATDSVDPTPFDQLRYGKVEVDGVAETIISVHGVWPEPDTSRCAYDSGAPYFPSTKTVRPPSCRWKATARNARTLPPSR